MRNFRLTSSSRDVKNIVLNDIASRRARGESDACLFNSLLQFFPVSIVYVSFFWQSKIALISTKQNSTTLKYDLVTLSSRCKTRNNPYFDTAPLSDWFASLSGNDGIKLSVGKLLPRHVAKVKRRSRTDGQQRSRSVVLPFSLPPTQSQKRPTVRSFLLQLHLGRSNRRYSL